MVKPSTMYKWAVFPAAWDELLRGGSPERVKTRFNLDDEDYDRMFSKFDERVRGEQDRVCAEDKKRIWKAAHLNIPKDKICTYWNISPKFYAELAAADYYNVVRVREEKQLYSQADRREFLTDYWNWKAYRDVSHQQLADFYHVSGDVIQAVISTERGGKSLPLCIREFICNLWDDRCAAGSFAALAEKYGLKAETARQWVLNYGDVYKPIDWYGPLEPPPIYALHIDAVKRGDSDVYTKTKPIRQDEQNLIRLEACYGVTVEKIMSYWNLTQGQVEACLEEESSVNLREAVGTEYYRKAAFEEALHERRAIRQEGLSVRELAEKFNLPVDTVRNIVRTSSDYSSSHTSISPELAAIIRAEYAPSWSIGDSELSLGRKFGLTERQVRTTARRLNAEQAAERQADDERQR